VWQGKPVKFAFDVKNSGDGDLTIRLKGG